MLAPLKPLAAYRVDLERAPGRQEFSARDGEWLLLATILARLAGLEAAERPAFAARASLGELSGMPIARALELYGSTRDLDQLARETQRVVESIEGVGAFTLAYTMLYALSRMLERGSEAMRGRTIAQMGRVARQVGELQQALELYSTALAVGRRVGDADLICRAAMGIGVVANSRGNYPRARRTFERVLAIARRHGLDEFTAAAHHGLMRGALAAGDPDAALAHGWEAFRRGPKDADERAEILANLAETCAVAGEYRAALVGYTVAAKMTGLSRIRLASLGGAVVAAASLRDRAALERLTHQTEDEVARSGEPYEAAQSLLELAMAWQVIGSREQATVYRERALSLARQYGFTEVVYRAEEQPARAVAEAAPPPPLEARAVDVVRSMERLDWRTDGDVRAPCR